MGLYAHPEGWHGAYSAFSRWRNKLAETAGYAVAKIDWEEEHIPIPIRQPLIDWGHVSQAQLRGEWDETPDDPLIVLLAHSDFDGVIKPEQAGPLADRLEKLIPDLPEGQAPGHIRNWRDKTQTFVDGLRQVVKGGEAMQFG